MVTSVHSETSGCKSQVTNQHFRLLVTSFAHRHSLTLLVMALPTQVMQTGFVSDKHFCCHRIDCRLLNVCLMELSRQQAHLAELGISHDCLDEVCWANADFLC